MIRSILVVTFAAVALIALGSELTRPPAPVLACTVAWPTLEEALEQAAVAGIVRAVEVGGPDNRAPTLTPTATPTSTATAGPDETPLPVPTSTVPLPRMDPVELTGFGATLQVAVALVGPDAGPMHVDDDGRRRIEHWIRMLDASDGGLTSCPITLGVYRYEAGADYVSIVGEPEGRGLNTIVRWRIDGDDVVIRPPDAEFLSEPLLIVSPATYERYFAGIQATFADQIVMIDAERVPLATLIAAMRGLLGLTPPVIPPDTGNAGLAASR